MRALFITLLLTGCAHTPASFSAFDTTIMSSTDNSVTFTNGVTATVERQPTYFVPSDPQYFKPGTDTQPFYAEPNAAVIVYQRDGMWGLCYDGLHYALESLSPQQTFAQSQPKPITYHQLDAFSACE